LGIKKGRKFTIGWKLTKVIQN